jgi:hypothetical protein
MSRGIAVFSSIVAAAAASACSVAAHTPGALPPRSRRGLAGRRDRGRWRLAVHGRVTAAFLLPARALLPAACCEKNGAHQLQVLEGALFGHTHPAATTVRRRGDVAACCCRRRVRPAGSANAHRSHSVIGMRTWRAAWRKGDPTPTNCIQLGCSFSLLA